ncbi:MAG: retropepsin-like domain-containing protein [Defluviitaleaceae bacterium]|nr:retropepsin-like domain-containing protein [Defluviitaleaceae bacterium]MCL2262357.1 retropepsin-like domain-containing protein [Defluviitaleaceae bacterium]
MKLKLAVDPNNQWFVPVWVLLNGQMRQVMFKVDTGCDSVILSHSTLKRLNISTEFTDLSKLLGETGRLASGKKSEFKNLGAVSLYSGKNQLGHICDVRAMCHATRKTNDLLGTSVLKQFGNVNFNLADGKYMELKN